MRSSCMAEVLATSVRRESALCRSPFPTTGTPLAPIAEAAHEPRASLERTSAGGQVPSGSPPQPPVLQQLPRLHQQQQSHPGKQAGQASQGQVPPSRITELWDAGDDASDLVPPTGVHKLARTPPVCILTTLRPLRSRALAGQRGALCAADATCATSLYCKHVVPNAWKV